MILIDSITLPQSTELTKIIANTYDPSIGCHSYITCNWINQSPASLSMLANKLYAYALYRLNEDVFQKIEVMDGINMDQDLEFCLSLSDFRNAFDWRGHSGMDYIMAEKAVNELGSLSMSVRRKKQPGISKISGIIHLFPTVLLSDNEYIYIRVNKNAFPYLKLMENRKNFTVYALEEMKVFKTNYAYQLYRYLKSFAYTPSWQKTKINSFQRILSIEELRFIVGTSRYCPRTWKRINANLVQEIDFTKELELSIKADETDYPEWSDFRKYVLNPSIKEISNVSALDVSYTTIRKGKGGKVSAVIFNFSYKEDPQSSEDVIRLCAAKLSGIADYFCEADLERFAKEAHGDADAVLEKFDLFKTQIDEIKNPTGYMIEAIRSDWKNTSDSRVFTSDMNALEDIIKESLSHTALNIHNDLIISKMAENAWKRGLQNDEIKRRIYTISRKTNLTNPAGYLLWAMNSDKFTSKQLPDKSNDEEKELGNQLEGYFLKANSGAMDKITEDERSAYEHFMGRSSAK